MLHVGENFEKGQCACQCHHPCVAKQVRGKRDQFLPAGMALNDLARIMLRRHVKPRKEHCWIELEQVKDWMMP